MVWLDWCQVIDWYDALDENDRCPSGNQLIKMDHWYDALMKMDQWFVIDTWCIVDIYDAVVNWCKDESILSYHGW